jgi:hypothetical protein
MDGLPAFDEMRDYIRQSATARGIDPAIALRVARSEGLAPGVWQSKVRTGSGREQSYGPFQLYVGGGLGNQFAKATGLDPSDPSTWREGVDFALDHARKNGWGAWYGAKKVGVTGKMGIGEMPEGGTQVAQPVQPRNAVGGLVDGILQQHRQTPTPQARPNPIGEAVRQTIDLSKEMTAAPIAAANGLVEPPVQQSTPPPEPIVPTPPQVQSTPAQAAAFDPTTAAPAQAAAFDPSSAQPVEATQPGGALRAATRSIPLLPGIANAITAGGEYAVRQSGLGEVIGRATGIGGGEPKPYGDILRGMASQDAALRSAHPVASVVGNVLGTGATIPLAAGMPGAAATGLGGRTLAGIGYGGAGGAIEGATDSATLSGAAGGALGGAAVGGAVGAVAAPVLRTIGRVFGSMGGSQRMAFQHLAERVKLPDETKEQAARRLHADFMEYRQVFGRNPRTAELLEHAQAKALAGGGSGLMDAGIRSSERAVDIARQAEQASAVARQGLVSNALQRGRPVVSQTEVRAAASDSLDATMGRIGQTPVTLSAPELELLSSQPVQAILQGRAYGAVREAIEGAAQGQPVTLRVLEDVRLAMQRGAGSSNPTEAHLYRGLRDDVRAIGEAASPEYAAGLTRFARSQHRADGVETGRAAVSNTASTAEVDTAFRREPANAYGNAGRVGQREGFRSQLVERAQQSPNAAAETARRLAEDVGLNQRSATLQGQTEAARQHRVGELATRAARGMAAVTPTAKAQPSHAAEATLHGVIGFASPVHAAHWLAGPILHSLRGIPPNTARRLAELATDPAQTPAVIQYLVRRGMSRGDASQYVSNVLTLTMGRGVGALVAEQEK